MIVTENQPDGTPTWIDLGVPDLDRAMDFYGALFGWQFDVGPVEYGRYTTAYHDGGRVAALAPSDPDATRFWWNVYLATSDCDATAAAVERAGGVVVDPPSDVMDQGRMAIVRDPAGGQFGLWQGRRHIGCERVNEPNTLVRNDLVTDQPAVARPFYAEVFGFTLDGNPDVPDFDFTFLRRPDGHEIGGIMGVPPEAGTSWSTTFEVENTDAVVARAVAAGGTVGPVDDMVYGRLAAITDPFGAEFSVIARPR
jgi:predicted enzyme related to lactoylglutathione lyase